jgi:hypothetical protein
LMRGRIDAQEEAQKQLDGLRARDLVGRTSALAAALTQAVASLVGASEFEREYSRELQRVLDHPELAELHQTISDYERMRRDGLLERLPASALQAIQVSVDAAQASFSRASARPLARRAIAVPVAVASMSYKEATLRIVIAVPVGIPVVDGPMMRLTLKVAQAIREAAVYLDLAPDSVAVQQHLAADGASVVRLEAPLGEGRNADAAAEAMEVMLDVALTEDADLHAPVLLMPYVWRIPISVIDGLHAVGPTPKPVAAVHLPPGERVPLEDAARDTNTAPVALAIRLALHGMPVENDGLVLTDSMIALDPTLARSTLTDKIEK